MEARNGKYEETYEKQLENERAGCQIEPVVAEDRQSKVSERISREQKFKIKDRI